MFLEFARDSIVYLRDGNSVDRLHVTEIEFSQSFRDKNYETRTLHNLSEMHEGSSITTANPAQFSLTIPMIRSSAGLPTYQHKLVTFGIDLENNQLKTFDLFIETLSEGYKASLLKEGMMKEYREYVDEEDAPDIAKVFKEAIKNENWDLAGINYGYMVVITQKRGKAEEEARQEAQIEAVKGAAKGFARGVSKGIKSSRESRAQNPSKKGAFLTGALTGAAASHILSNKSDKPEKKDNRVYWEG